jgi:hypothetical protein
MKDTNETQAATFALDVQELIQEGNSRLVAVKCSIDKTPYHAIEGNTFTFKDGSTATIASDGITLTGATNLTDPSNPRI